MVRKNLQFLFFAGVAVDWISRRVYWTDSGKDTIEVANIDNATMRAVLVNRGLVNPRGIAVDPMQK
jgi:nidogen (entactin)